MFGLKRGNDWVAKKVKFTISLVIICVLLFSMASGTLKAAGKNEDEEINLKGQWKVTDYVASQYITATYDHYEDYLGRSIIIEPNRIIESFGSYMKQEDAVFRYRTVEVETVNGGTYGSRLGEEWYRKYAEQKVTVVKFSGKWNSMSFVVTEEGEVLCWYLFDIYYMERYREAVTDMREEELYGEWKVRRLVSYQDGWREETDGLVRSTGKKTEGIFIRKAIWGIP